MNIDGVSSLVAMQRPAAPSQAHAPHVVAPKPSPSETAPASTQPGMPMDGEPTDPDVTGARTHFDVFA